MQQKKNNTKSKSKPRYDHKALECAYIIAEEIKVKEFCNEHKITPQHLYRLRKKFGWDEKREKYRQSIADEVIEKTREHKISTLVEASNMMDAIIMNEVVRLKEISDQDNQFYKHATSAKERLEGGLPPVIELDMVDTKRHAEYMRSLEIEDTMINRRINTNEDTANDDKVQINFINGCEEYGE